MLRLVVNATTDEIARSTRGPIAWDIACYGGWLDAAWDELQFTDLAGARRLSATTLRRGRSEPADAGSSVPTTMPRAIPSSAGLAATIGRLGAVERWVRAGLRTDLVIGTSADAVVSHLRFARSIPKRIPLVYSTTGIVPATWEWRSRLDAESTRTKDVRVEASLCQRAEVVVCWTNHGAENLVRLGGVPEARVRVVPPLLPLADPSGPPLGASGAIRVVFVGEAMALKGLPELLSAMEAVPEAELHVVGPRPPAVSPPRTTWHGPLAPGRIAQLLNGADIFALPGHQESFGVCFLEAMRAGTAVLGTRLGTVTELVGDGGVLVAPGDVTGLTKALRALVADSGMRESLAAAGQRRYCERYAPEVVAPLFEAAVTAALS